jgi:hypothetical protein
MGAGDLAIITALSALAAAPDDAEPWLRASLQEGAARAHAAAGRAEARDAALLRARTLIATEPDEQSRALIEAQIASVPRAD